MRDRCEICGSYLIYATQKEDCKELECQVSKQEDLLNIFCPNGHYICRTYKKKRKTN